MSSSGSDEVGVMKMEVVHGGIEPCPRRRTYFRMEPGVSSSDYRQFPCTDDEYTYNDEFLETNIHHGHGRRHEEQAYADLKVEQPPQTCRLESESEEGDHQLAGCWPWPRSREPTRSPLSASTHKELVELDGEAETRRRMNDEHHGQRASSRRRMKSRLGPTCPPKLHARRYEEFGSESDFECETIVYSSREPVSGSISEHRELRRQAVAAGPDSGVEWTRQMLRPIVSTRQDEDRKGCPSSSQREIYGKILTPVEVDSAILKLQSNMTEEILGLGRELRMQIIRYETKHRRSTRRTCKLHYFLLQQRVGNLLRKRYGLLLGGISEKVQHQVQHLENHFLDKLTQTSSTLRQLIENHNFSTSSSSSSTTVDHFKRQEPTKLEKDVTATKISGIPPPRR